MEIQSFNTETPSVNFQRNKKKKGSFAALKSSKYFPQNRNTPLYDTNIRAFYSQLINLKKRADKNDLYNVILKPDKNVNDKHGFIVIENKEGREQYGFKCSFNDILQISEFEPRSYYTKKDFPNPISRWFRNQQISKNNKKIINRQINFNKFLNIIYKRIESFVNNAEYLADLHKLKEGSPNVGKN